MTPATIYLRGLPDTLAGLRTELETKRARLRSELDAIEQDHARVTALEAVARQGERSIHLLRESA